MRASATEHRAPAAALTIIGRRPSRLDEAGDLAPADRVVERLAGPTVVALEPEVERLERRLQDRLEVVDARIVVQGTWHSDQQQPEHSHSARIDRFLTVETLSELQQ